MLNTSVELEEAKTMLNICAQLNVSEVQAKTVARFIVLLDLSLLGESTCVHAVRLGCSMFHTCTQS